MKQNNHPTIFVVLGATGDLMAKKIVPALFRLYENGCLPEKFKLLGVARRDWSDDHFKDHVKSILSVKIPDASEKKINAFLEIASYQKLTFEERGDYKGLGEELARIDGTWGQCSNKLFYLSVPPQFYDVILGNLHASGLTVACGENLSNPEWTRVIIEKPFGSDEKTAKALDLKLSKLFKEDQVYRIDHYLAKEMLQNILAFRFGNNLFEGEWDRRFVERISVRLFESIGVEDRGAFYDAVGTLRDVGQNHLLAMLALITMERPLRYDASAIRRARADAIEALAIPNVQEAAQNSFRAQYDGFRSIKGVAPDSQTETYFRVKGFLQGDRWAGVPCTIESGKRLGFSQKEIEIILRHPSPCLCEPGKAHLKNRILIRMEPAEGITVVFFSKKPGYAIEMEERSFKFEFRTEGKRSQYTEEYEKLLLDCIDGDQTLFVSSEEISAMWRFIDPFVAAWQKNLVPLKQYVPDGQAILAEAEVSDVASSPRDIFPKEIGVFGLGKMGAGVARQLREKGWQVVAANRSPEAVEEIRKEGIDATFSFEEMSEKLKSPRIVWLMITAGKPVDDALFGNDGIVAHLKRGDIVIDGGNSFYEDTMRRAKLLKKKGIEFMDVGFSGGPSGARHGGSLMVGGSHKLFAKLEPLFADLSVPEGYCHFGSAGAGHFVKMVHNGIEYGMMQSLAEGFTLMKKSPFKLDLQKVAGIYNRGSVIESRLVGWLENAFRVHGKELKPVSGSVAYTGEGEWTVKTGKKMNVKLPVIEDSFKFRVKSGKSPSYTGKILSALRNQFGGHAVFNNVKKKKSR
jgi:glucose-6-phosphate 1-dehydrogenase